MFHRTVSRSLAVAASSVVGISAATYYSRNNKEGLGGGLPQEPWSNVDKPLPTRAEMFREIERRIGLNSTRNKKNGGGAAADDDDNDDNDDDSKFDVLVIGGGATGSGVALDAQTRGLKTILVERDDFASGTSSKSTKLVHG